MNFEGKTCGICDKGKLHSFRDEVSDGIYVEAYKCDNGGHVSYSREVAAKVEALLGTTTQKRSIVRIGSSIAVPIPASIARLLDLKPKEKVFVTTKDNHIIITPTPTGN